MRITKNCMVTFRYRIEPDANIDFPYPQGPFRMNSLIGYGKLPPVLEKSLAGLDEGEQIEVYVPPEDLFGAVAKSETVTIPIDDVVDPHKLEVGGMHHVVSEDNTLRPFRVVAINKGEVVADFNHPFAGKHFTLFIEVEKVRWATLDEIKEALQFC